MNEIKAWDSLSSISYKTNIEEVLKYIEENNITDFSVIDKNGFDGEEYGNRFISSIYNRLHNDKKILFVDDKHPFLITVLGGILIENNFYEKYKDVILDKVKKNIEKEKYISISKYTYDEEFLKNVIPNVKSIRFDSDINISDDVKNLCKKSRINATLQTKDGEFIEISSDKILGVLYKDVVSDEYKSIRLKNDITDFENLKYIGKDKIIKIDYKDVYKEDAILNEDKEYDKYYNIIAKLRENNQNNEVHITVNNKEAFVKSKLYNSDFDYVVVNGIHEFKSKKIKKDNELLELMVKDIKDSSYSPLEKYIAVYNIAKKFKAYLESPNDKDESRYVDKLLYNDYMVCVGYASLLQELLNKVGIKSYKYGVAADISYDGGFTLEEKPIDLGGHARLIVDIKDPKYNIDGFYVTDPTGDNYLEQDYYNHSLMSFDKTSQEKRYFKLTDEDLLLNCKSKEEYIDKVNLLFDMQKRKSYIKTDEKALSHICKKIKDILLNLYPDKYVALTKDLKEFEEKKYSIVREEREKMEEKLSYELIDKAGDFFIEKLGKDIKIDTLVDAACNVNKDVFNLTDEQLKVYKEDLLNKNRKRDAFSFPYYYNSYYSKDEEMKKAV